MMDGMMDKNSLRVDRSALSIGTLTESSDEKDYWLSQTPQARLAAIELMRRIVYGDAACSGRLQRILEVAELIPG
jgi:hypothetical protein